MVHEGKRVAIYPPTMRPIQLKMQKSRRNKVNCHHAQTAELPAVGHWGSSKWPEKGIGQIQAGQD